MCSCSTGFLQVIASGKNFAMVAKCTGLRSKNSKKKKHAHTHYKTKPGRTRTYKHQEKRHEQEQTMNEEEEKLVITQKARNVQILLLLDSVSIEHPIDSKAEGVVKQKQK
jgi:hypothetical protein